MNASATKKVVLKNSEFPLLLSALAEARYRVIGPTVRDGAIVLDEIRRIEDLPAGWTEELDGGKYRLIKGDSPALFDPVVGPHSWKKYLHAPNLILWRAFRKNECTWEEQTPSGEIPKHAFLGVRSCDLRAIQIQDRVFLEGPYRDPVYEAHRKNTFLIAANCARAGGTCFCVSMKTGPVAESGFDLAFTEIVEGGHRFLFEAGSAKGEEMLRRLPVTEASPLDLRNADERTEKAAAQMGRAMDTTGIKELLYRSYEHQRWEETAARCLSCGNCTLVCPTCFCTTVEDVTSLDGRFAERRRRWDSCFTMDFSYIHGGTVRATVKSRYRQWLTHKLATWIDQFGTSGCVGCGRCIAWCPVGIDLTEEIQSMRAKDPRHKAQGVTMS